MDATDLRSDGTAEETRFRFWPDPSAGPLQIIIGSDIRHSVSAAFRKVKEAVRSRVVDDK